MTREYWRSHTGRFVHGQGAAVERADVIFCEWCLGNAAWWSQNLPPGKRLLIRFHLQELHTNHPAEVDYTRVEKVVFISPHVMREAIAKFGIPPEKCQVIPISVRLKAKTGTPSELRTRRDVLAMVGLTPWRKRPDRALELLRSLRERYPNLTLHIKGHTPSDYAWMGNRREELERYQSLFKEILTLEREGIIRMSGYDDELEAFYGGAGWVLSLSDFEGCHTAVAEGGAMGCLPLMTSWAGADEVYPPHLVQRDLAGVVRYFDAHYETFEEHSSNMVDEFQGLFGIESVFKAWHGLLVPN